MTMNINMSHIVSIKNNHKVANFDMETGDKFTDDEKDVAKKAIIEGEYAKESPDSGRLFLTRKGLQLWTSGGLTEQTSHRMPKFED